MTERERDEYQERRLEVLQRDGWRCVVCSRPATQLAHRIPQSRMYLRMYGPEVVHHPHNVASVCGLRCNAAVLIGNRPTEVFALVERIRAEIGGQT